MKTPAVLFTEPHKASLEEVSLPEPTARDILIDVEVSGVSAGTERWAYLGKRPELRFPLAPGYLGIGTIVSCGKEAEGNGWTTGQRVNFFRSRFDGPLNESGWMGSHLRHAVVDVCGPRVQDPGGLCIHWCEPVPDGVGPEDVALCGLAAVALRGIEMAIVPAETRVLVAGLGVIGQSAAQIVALKGASVSVMDLDPRRCELASRLAGASPLASLSEVADKAREIGGFDVIIDTTSSAAVVNELFGCLTHGGKFVFQGWYPPPTPLNLDRLHQKLPSCFFPCAHTGEAVAAAMRLVRGGYLRLSDLIDEELQPRDAAAFYERLAAPGSAVLGAVFNWRAL
ncbi:MAG: zinc-binding alcohol dehydrogenase [Terrimicrobiaceae bacterium]|nr:zinc-binding alcohol dehydrogenase [Terrimicrobiaceae bacterium]